MPTAKKKKQQTEPPRRQPPAADRRGKPFWTKTRLWIALTALGALLVVAFVTFSRSAKKDIPDDPLLATELPALDGGTFRLADYEGKLLVLNLWATWCGPCRNEVPHLIQIGREYRDRGVEVVGLSTEDPQTARDKARAFAREFGIDYRLGFSAPQFSMRLMRDKTNIPQVFLLRDGRVLNRFIGFNPQTSPQKLRDAIDQALAAK